MNHPVIANLSGKERHKSLIEKNQNHQGVKVINKDYRQKDTFLK